MSGWPDRFMARVLPEPNSGCWLWDGDLSAAAFARGAEAMREQIVGRITDASDPTGIARTAIRALPVPEDKAPTHAVEVKSISELSDEEAAQILGDKA